MFLIYVLKDDANLGAGPLTPLGLFFIIFGIGACWGWETGYGKMGIDRRRTLFVAHRLTTFACSHQLGSRFWATFDVVLPRVRPQCMGCW